MSGAAWAVAACMCAVSTSMRTVTACMQADADTLWDIAAFMNAAYVLCGLSHHLHGLLNPLCGLLQPACMLCIWGVGYFILPVGCCMLYVCCHQRRQGKKTGNKGIAFCGGYRAFANVPLTHPSLTTRAYVGLRFYPPPRWSRPTAITGN